MPTTEYHRRPERSFRLGYCVLTGIGAAAPPRPIVMQPDDPSITAVSTAASAAAFTIFLMAFVLMGHTFLLVDKPWQLSTAGF